MRLARHVVAAAILIGCSDPTNREACRDYYDALVDLECVEPGDFDVEERCPPELDQDPCSLVGFYECRAEKARCSEGQLDLSGQDGCVLACPE